MELIVMPVAVIGLFLFIWMLAEEATASKHGVYETVDEAQARVEFLSYACKIIEECSAAAQSRQQSSPVAAIKRFFTRFY